MDWNTDNQQTILLASINSITNQLPFPQPVKNSCPPLGMQARYQISITCLPSQRPHPPSSFKPRCHVMPSTPSSLCFHPSLPSSLQTAHGRLHLHSHPSASPSIPKQPRRAALSIQPSHSHPSTNKSAERASALQTALTTQRLFGFIVRSLCAPTESFSLA